MAKLKPEDKVYIDRQTGAFAPLDEIDMRSAGAFRERPDGRGRGLRAHHLRCSA